MHGSRGQPTTGGRNEEAEPRWATATLDRSLWHASALGLGLWQLAIGILVTLRNDEHQVAVLVAHLVVAGIAAAAGISRGSDAIRVGYFGVLFGVLVADLLVCTDGFALLVLCLTFSLVTATPFLVLGARAATAVTAVAVVAAVGLTTLTEQPGPEQITAALVVPATCYSFAAWVIVTVLRRFAASVDEIDRAARAEHERLIAARSSARTAADYARTLHDTVVNTLAAIASGGPALANGEKVRARCARDVHTIRVLEGAGGQPEEDLERVGDELSLTISWTGLTGQQLRDQLARIAPGRRTALRGVVKELLLNVEKHSGTSAAAVAVGAEDDALHVTVADEGVGFDTDRGTSPRVQSAQLRASEAGLTLVTRSAPGAGTLTSIRCTYDDPAATDAAGEADGWDLGPRASQIRRTGSWAWALLVSIAGLLITAAGTPTRWSCAGAALVAIAALGAWGRCRSGAALTGLPAALTALAVPVAFVLGFLGATSPGGDLTFWPVIGLTPLLVVLLNVTRTPFPLAAAVVLLLVATLACAGPLGDRGVPASGAALVNACIQLAQLGQWVIFAAVLDQITAQAIRTGRRAQQDQAETAAREAARMTQERWRDAQLEVALDLLGDVAEGRRSPHDPVTQSHAGREEHALRQLLLLDPDLVHLGPWLARMIARSRRQDVRVTVCAGGVDLPDAESADAVGQSLTALVDGLSAGTQITVAYFGANALAPVTVVGPAGLGMTATARAKVPVRVTRFDTQDMVELATA